MPGHSARSSRRLHATSLLAGVASLALLAGLVAVPVAIAGRIAGPTGSVGAPSSPRLAAAACPVSPITVDQLLAADHSCFGGETIEVTGWLAEPWGVGGLSSGIEPAWLGEGLTPRALWLKPRGANGCVADHDCVFAFLHVSPDSGPSLEPLDRWVRVSGHFDDPLSATCHWNGTNDPKTPEQSVEACREAFVVTSLTAVPAVTVTVRAPKPGATGVSRSTKVVVRFSEAVTGVSSSSFLLRDKATGKVVAATVTYNAATRTATLRPKATLTGRRAYVVGLTSAISNTAGVRLAPTTWTFATRR